MDLIERYVSAVGRHLPRRNRADIQAELQSTLVDTLEARAGGEVAEDNVVALLKEFGSPEKVAASYWPEGQYLIGPRLYPLFRLVAGIALTVFVIVQLALLGVMVVFKGEPVQWIESFGGLIGSIFTVIGAVVLTFAIMQRLDVKPETEEEEWDPRELPGVNETESINRGGIVIEITFSLLLVALLVLLPGRFVMINIPGLASLENPVIVRYLPLIIPVLLLGIIIDLVLLWRDRWEAGTRIVKIGADVLGLYVLYLLAAGHTQWLSQHGITGFLSGLTALPGGNPSSGEGMQILFMSAFRLAFVVALIVSVVDVVNSLYRLVTRSSMRTRVPLITN